MVGEDVVFEASLGSVQMERGSLTPCLAASRVVGVGAPTLVCAARGLLEPPDICQASERARVGSPRGLGCGLWAVGCMWVGMAWPETGPPPRPKGSPKSLQHPVFPGGLPSKY